MILSFRIATSIWLFLRIRDMPQVTHSLSDKVTWRSALFSVDHGSPDALVYLDGSIFSNTVESWAERHTHSSKPLQAAEKPRQGKSRVRAAIRGTHKVGRVPQMPRKPRGLFSPGEWRSAKFAHYLPFFPSSDSSITLSR